MANQPKTPMVCFRTARKDELEALAMSRGLSVTELMRETVDTLLGGRAEGDGD